MSRIQSAWCAIASPRDVRDSRALWEQVFPEDSGSFLDYYDVWKMRDNRIETRRRKGQLISMIHWNPYPVHWGDRIANSSYVIAVATLPEYRHQGLMAGQLRDGLNRFYREKEPFIFLMPADPAIYEPFDFRFVYDRHVMEIEGEAKDTGLTVRPLLPEEWEAAAQFMEEQLKDRFPVHTLRSREYVARTAMECRSEGGDVEGIFREDVMVGCLSWWGDESVEIREILLEEDLRPQLSGLLRSRWPEAARITAVAGWLPEGEGEPIIMARLVELQAFLEPVKSRAALETVICVEDRLLNGNNGYFRWQMGPEGSRVEVLPEADCAAQIRIHAADLIRWIMGGVPAEETDAELTEAGRSFAQQAELPGRSYFTEIV